MVDSSSEMPSYQDVHVNPQTLQQSLDFMTENVERVNEPIHYFNIYACVYDAREAHKIVTQAPIKTAEAEQIRITANAKAVELGIAVPKRAEQPFNPFDPETLRKDSTVSFEEVLKELKSVGKSSETITLYRGIDNLEEYQLCGGLRHITEENGSKRSLFTLQELIELPDWMLESMLDGSFRGDNDEDFAEKISLEISNGLNNSLKESKCYNLSQSGMATSPFISTSIDKMVAAGFAPSGKVLTLQVPVDAVVNLEKYVRRMVEKDPELDLESPYESSERERGVIGWINPEWIVSVEDNPRKNYTPLDNINFDLDHLKQMYEQGLISQEGYERSVSNVKRGVFN